MKRLGLIAILLFTSFYVIAKDVLRVPEYSVEKETPIYTIISYVIEQCHNKGYTVTNSIPFSIAIEKQKDDSYLVRVEKSLSEILSYGNYCGYVVVDGLKTFISGKTIDIELYKECDSYLVRMDNFTKITVNNPVPDGVGPIWYFIIKDKKIYVAKFLNGEL